MTREPCATWSDAKRVCRARSIEHTYAAVLDSSPPIREPFTVVYGDGALGEMLIRRERPTYECLEGQLT